MEQHDEPSLLWKLPLELRLKIYELVLDHGLLHFHMEHRPRCPIRFDDSLQCCGGRTWVARTCVDMQTPRETYERWVRSMASAKPKFASARAHQQYLAYEDFGASVASEMRHWTCRAETDLVRRRERIDLRLLRVCRAVYAEARRVPYAASIFSFRSTTQLDCFLHDRRAWQVGAIRSVHLDLKLRHEDNNPSLALVGRLSGLRTVYLAITLKFPQRDTYKDVAATPARQLTCLRGPLELAMHRLRTVMVIVDDLDFMRSIEEAGTDEDDGHYAWCMQGRLESWEKLEWARNLEACMLGAPQAEEDNAPEVSDENPQHVNED